MLLALSVLWGTSFFLLEIALRQLPPFTIVLARVGLAALVLIPVLRAAGLHLPSGVAQWRPYFVMAALNNVLPFSLIVWGQTVIASGLAAILNATTPFFAVILAHFLTRDEKLQAHRLIGVLVGAGGVAVLMGPDALKGLTADFLGQVAVLLASVFYALSGIFGKRFKAPPLVNSASQMIAATILMTPLVFFFDRPWTLPMPGPATIAALVCLAVLATALAYILYFRILATAGATNLLLVTLLIPVTAIVLGVAVLGEPLGLRHYAGMAVIGLALLIVDGRPARWAMRGFRAARARA